MHSKEIDQGNTFILKEVIDELIDPEKSLEGPLFKLLYFSKLTENQTLISFISREINGYGGEDRSVFPEYRKIYVELEVDLQTGYNTHPHKPLPFSMIDKTLRESLNPMLVTHGVKYLEALIKKGTSGENQFKYRELPMEMLFIIQPAAEKLYRSDIDVDVIAGRLRMASNQFQTILTAIRSKLLEFTMEVGANFGYNIQINSFQKHKKENNESVVNIMNTHITNTGDGNVVNTGDNSRLTVNITIHKGDTTALSERLRKDGIDEADIVEIAEIVQSEQPDPEKKTLGDRAINWIGKVSMKALSGVGKIATSVSSAVLAEYLKQFYGLNT